MLMGSLGAREETTLVAGSVVRLKTRREASVPRVRETVTQMLAVLETWYVETTTVGSIIVGHHLVMTAVLNLRDQVSNMKRFRFGKMDTNTIMNILLI